MNIKILFFACRGEKFPVHLKVLTTLNRVNWNSWDNGFGLPLECHSSAAMPVGRRDARNAYPRCSSLWTHEESGSILFFNFALSILLWPSTPFSPLIFPICLVCPFQPLSRSSERFVMKA